MWALAFAVIAIALVAFAYAYAALHTAPWIPLKTAEDLYWAKRAINYTVTEEVGAFYGTWNVSLVYRLGNYVVPVAYRVSSRAGNAAYRLYIAVKSCRAAVDRSGRPVTIYTAELAHSVDPIPWLEIYAAWPASGGGRLDLMPLRLERAHYALVYHVSGGFSELHVAVPSDAVGFVVVDYPARFVLGRPPGCKP